jgi:hypothetical protein
MTICRHCHQAYGIEREPDCPHLYRVSRSTRSKVGRQEIVRELVEAALVTDGAHHKQWYLERIAQQMDIPLLDHESGIAP